MRRALILVAAAVLALGAVASTLATSGTGAGGDFVVSVSLTPDQVERGGQLAVTESVENVTDSRQLARITQSLTGPSGNVYRISYPLLVPAGKTLSISFTIPILRLVRPGTYTLTLTAANAHGTATASASVEVV